MVRRGVDLSKPSRGINKPGKIIYGYVIKSGESFVMLYGHLPRTAFPARILLLSGSKNCRYFGLRLVCVLSDISQSLVKLHSISSVRAAKAALFFVE